MIDIDWKPSDRKLRQFAAASIVGFPLLALLLKKLLPLVGIVPPDSLLIAASIFGLLTAVIGWIVPRCIQPIYLALVVITIPIGIVISAILPPLIYYGLFTPIGLGMRALGKDPLEKELTPGKSYWKERNPSPTASSYYRQY